MYAYTQGMGTFSYMDTDRQTDTRKHTHTQTDRNGAFSLPFMLPDEVWGVCGACEVRGNGEPEEVAECSNLELTALHISNMLNAVVMAFSHFQAATPVGHPAPFTSPA